MSEESLLKKRIREKGKFGLTIDTLPPLHEFGIMWEDLKEVLDEAKQEFPSVKPERKNYNIEECYQLDLAYWTWFEKWFGSAKGEAEK